MRLQNIHMWCISKYKAVGPIANLDKDYKTDYPKNLGTQKKISVCVAFFLTIRHIALNLEIFFNLKMCLSGGWSKAYLLVIYFSHLLNHVYFNVTNTLLKNEFRPGKGFLGNKKHTHKKKKKDVYLFMYVYSVEVL